MPPAQQGSGPPHTVGGASRLVILLLPAAVLLLLLPPAFVASVPPWVATSAAFSFLALTCLVAFRTVRKRGANPWTDATAAMSFYYAVLFGGGLITICFWDRVVGSALPHLTAGFSMYQDVLSDVSRLTSLGGVGLLIGTSLASRFGTSWPKGVRWRFDTTVFFAGSIAYLPVCIICMYLTTSGVLGNLSPFYYVLMIMYRDMAYVFCILAAYCVASSRGRPLAWLVLLCIYLAILVTPAVRAGVRGAMLMPLAVPAFGYAMARGKLPWKYMSVGLVPLALILLPWATYLKEASATGYAFDRRALLAADRFRESTYDERLGVFLWSTVRRFAIPSSLAACRKQVPDLVPHQHGRIFLVSLASLPPRIIWPKKPNVSYELNDYSRMVGILTPEDTRTSAVINAVGLYYFDFGALGIAFMCLLHGFCIGLLCQWLVRRCTWEWGASVFMFVTLSQPDFYHLVPWLSSAVRIIFVSLPILYVASNAKWRHLAN